jgi:hypothetical protein
LGLVDAVELQQFPIARAQFPLDVAVPPICSEPVTAIRLAVEGNVVWAFQADNIVALKRVTAVAARQGVLQYGKPELSASLSEGRDVPDLSFYGSKMTLLIPFADG